MNWIMIPRRATCVAQNSAQIAPCAATLFATLLMMLPASNLTAQGNAARALPARADTIIEYRSNTLLRVTKWSAFAATLGAAAYGLVKNQDADADYTELEKLCVADRLNCERRSGAAYADAALEQKYQAVRALDHKARVALLGSQIGVAATVVLFVIDLRHSRPPKDIPYHPSSLELAPGRDGSLQLRLTLPLPLRQ